LFVCGRIKDLIIVRGVKYSAHEIEAAVESASPQIQVGGVAAFRGDEDVETLILMAEVSVRNSSPTALKSHRLSARDAASSRSRSCGSALARFSKTSSGKIARSLTRQRWLDGELASRAIKVWTKRRSPSKWVRGSAGGFNLCSSRTT